jgi:alpha-L-fucosidase 2
LDFGRGADIQSFELELKTAVGKVHMRKGLIETFCYTEMPVGVVRVTGKEARLKVVPFDFSASYKINPDDSNEYPARMPSLLGYPSARQGRAGNLRWIEQGCADGLAFAVVVGQRPVEDGTEYVYTVSSTEDGPNPLEIGKQRVQDALETGTEKMLRSHKRWWKQFWSKSAVQLPDERIEKAYYLAQYFYGAGSRRGAPPIPLQGVWTEAEKMLPPWKGDYHHDFNTQMTYSAYLAANRLDSGLSFLDFMWDLLPVHREHAKKFYDTEGACVPGMTTSDGRYIAGWVQYNVNPTLGAWVGHLFYLHWRHTMDKQFLAERAYPYCKAISQCIEGLLEPDGNGKLKLPLSSSPEIHENKLEAWLTPNSNFDQSLMRWLFGALVEMSQELRRFKDKKHWQNILNCLDDLAVEDVSVFDLPDGPALMISPGEPLAESHRHFSHTMAIHPLGTMTIEGSRRDRQIIEQTMLQLDNLGIHAWWGLGLGWVANIAARIGHAERALTMLQLCVKGFLLRNGFFVNGDVNNIGVSSFKSRIFTIETNFTIAQSVHEMLLQSWGGILRLFPATSQDWADVSFENLRAEGAFLVSAQRKVGNTVSVQITAEQGGLLRLRDPFNRAKVRWNRRDIKRVGNNYQCRLPKGKTLEGRVAASR